MSKRLFYDTPSDSHQFTAADNRQHDLKGRTPERSEWLVAEGERSVTLGIMPPHHYAFEKNANITCFGGRFRVIQTLFLWGGRYSEGCANA